MGVSVQRYAPVTSPPGKRSDTQGDWMGPRYVKSWPLPGFDPLTVQSIAMTCSYILGSYSEGPSVGYSSVPHNFKHRQTQIPTSQSFTQAK
jgi:hypothetical protein